MEILARQMNILRVRNHGKVVPVMRVGASFVSELGNLEQHARQDQMARVAGATVVAGGDCTCFFSKVKAAKLTI